MDWYLKNCMLAGLLSSLVIAPATGFAAFQQGSDPDSLVVLEAENFSARIQSFQGLQWEPVTSPSGYVAASAMQAPEGSVEYPTNFETDGPRMDYQINFTQSGTHYVWAHVYSADGKSDTLHVGLNGSSPASGQSLRANPRGVWTWANVQLGTGQPIQVDVPSPGVHTLNIWMREANMIVDRIVVTPAASYTPTGTGPTESSQTGGGGNASPVASFSNSQVSSTLDVNFDSSGSSDSDGSIASYAWDFGDGNNGSGQTVSHSYSAAGTYNVSLTVTDNEGAINTLSQSVTVLPVGGGSSSGNYVLDIGSGTDSSGSVSNLNDLGAVSPVVLVDSSGTSGSATAVLRGFQAGNNRGENTATADFPASAMVDNFYVQKSGVALGYVDFSGLDPNTAYAVTVTGSRSGNDGGRRRWGLYTLTSSVSSDSGVLDASNNTDVLTLSGTTNGAGQMSLEVQVDPASSSNYAYLSAVKLVKTGGGGGNQSPAASFSSAQVSNTLSVGFDGSGSSDSDGSIASYTWDFGDGNTGSGQSPSHTYSTAGTYSVSLTVTDNEGAINTQSQSVTVSPIGGGTSSGSYVLDIGSGTDSSGNVSNLNDLGAVSPVVLVDSSGTSGSATAVLRGFQAGNNRGENTATADFPASAMVDNFYVQKSGVASGYVDFSGLDPNTAYAVTVTGSRSGNDGGRRRWGLYTLTSSVSSDSGVLDASNNTDVLTLSGTTNGAGQMSLEVQVDPASSSNYAYLSAVKLVKTGGGGGTGSPVTWPAQPQRLLQEGETLSFTVQSSGGESPQVSATFGSLPGSPSATDLGSGLLQFDWTAPFGSAGDYLVTLSVTDAANPAVSDQELAVLRVVGDSEITTLLQSASFNAVVAGEAENPKASTTGTSGHSWTARADGDASADTLLVALPDSGASVQTQIEADSPRIDFTVEFAEAGTYYLWIRGMAPDANGNSLHAGLNGLVQSTAMGITGFEPFDSPEWSGSTDAGRATIEVPSPGLHSLSLWMAEDGFAFDKFVLTTEEGFSPVLYGPSASPGGSAPEYPFEVDSHAAVWEFSDNPAFGRAQDALDNLDLVCSSCPSATTGLSGGAASFAGSHWFETEIAGPWVDGSSGWTLEARIRFSASCSGEQGILGKDGLGFSQVSLSCQNGDLVARISEDGTAVPELRSSSQVDDGQWHHIALVWDVRFNQALLYVNGALEASASPSESLMVNGSDSKWLVGRAELSGGPAYLIADLDAVAIHGRALRSDEIFQKGQSVGRGLIQGLWACESPVRMMPLGDSITAGSNRNGSELYGTYRSMLFDLLQTAGYSVDFVGGQTSRHAGDSDKDHEGWPGFNADQIRGRINRGMLDMNPPHLVMLHIGTNSVETSATMTENLLDRLTLRYPDMPTIVTKIIDRQVSDPDTIAYNSSLESDVLFRISQGEKYYLADMESLLNPATDYVDNLHPNGNGADKMALVWFDELQKVLPRCRPAAPYFDEPASLNGTVGASFRHLPDVGGHPLGYFELSTGPMGMFMNEATGEIVWESPVAGTYELLVEVSNNHGSDTHTYTLTIN